MTPYFIFPYFPANQPENKTKNIENINETSITKETFSASPNQIITGSKLRAKRQSNEYSINACANKKQMAVKNDKNK